MILENRRNRELKIFFDQEDNKSYYYYIGDWNGEHYNAHLIDNNCYEIVDNDKFIFIDDPGEKLSKFTHNLKPIYIEDEDEEFILTDKFEVSFY